MVSKEMSRKVCSEEQRQKKIKQKGVRYLKRGDN